MCIRDSVTSARCEAKRLQSAGALDCDGNGKSSSSSAHSSVDSMAVDAACGSAVKPAAALHTLQQPPTVLRKSPCHFTGPGLMDRTGQEIVCPVQLLPDLLEFRQTVLQATRMPPALLMSAGGSGDNVDHHPHHHVLPCTGSSSEHSAASTPAPLTPMGDPLTPLGDSQSLMVPQAPQQTSAVSVSQPASAAHPPRVFGSAVALPQSSYSVTRLLAQVLDSI